MTVLRVWTGDRPVGRLSALGTRGCSFVYDSGVAPGDAVSLTMPVRPQSYDSPNSVLPAFDVSLPEGWLLERIRRALAKDDSGKVAPVDILAVTGGAQIGRVSLVPEGSGPQRREPLGVIEWLLREKTSGDLIRALVDRHALESGVSGAMPKITGEASGGSSLSGTQRVTMQTSDWILKFDADDYPGLSLNEASCLDAARLAGNETAEAHLSDDGRMLAVRRFDRSGCGVRLGFEDFAALNAKTADGKFDGSIETALMKRAAAFAGSGARQALEGLYRQTVLNAVLRNGDAHLKNFGLVYSDTVTGPFHLAPAYDIVTTRAFADLKDDPMALTLEGTKRWPDRDRLLRLAPRARLRRGQAEAVMAETEAAVRRALPRMMQRLGDHGQTDLAERMAVCWNEGMASSLGAAPVALPNWLASGKSLHRVRRKRNSRQDRTDGTGMTERQ